MLAFARLDTECSRGDNRIWACEPGIFPNETDAGDLQALAINLAPVLERHALRG
jgi:hypothetical protein